MAPLKSLMCTAALMLFVAVVHFQRAEAQCGGFQDSCQQYAIGSDGVFTAQCLTDGDSYVTASINLDNYIGNSNGNLVDGAGFSASCQGEGWTNEKAPNVAFYIQASCNKDDGSLAHTSYDIGYHVGNANGVLSWHYC